MNESGRYDEPESLSGLGVYDNVWIMINNKPQERIIYSVTETMDTISYNFTTKTFYTVVNGILGNGQGNNKEVGVARDCMFRTKEELIKSLQED